MITNKRKAVGLGVGVAFIIFILDQISKEIILSYFSYGSSITVTSFLNIILAWNPGVGFGLLKADSIYGILGLIGLALAISIFLFYWLMRAKRWIELISISSILGGAIGNIIDRIRFGAVVDFIDIHGFGYHWPTFNIADSGITCGIIVLIFMTLWEKKNETS